MFLGNYLFIYLFLSYMLRHSFLLQLGGDGGGLCFAGLDKMKVVLIEGEGSYCGLSIV